MDLLDLMGQLTSGKVRDAEGLQRAKLEFCRRRGLGAMPRNAELLALASPADRAMLLPLLRTKPTRTAAGVAVVTAVTAPSCCPHGKCIFCPGGPDVGTPQSYLGTEPAIRRAAAAAYDPQVQVTQRLEQLAALGHPTDKVDLVIIGGTFTSQPLEYRQAFIRGCLDALNEAPSADLSEALIRNETAAHRCIGLTVETKPDRFVGPEVEECISAGVTRIELGVQSIHDDVLGASHRGHDDAHTRMASLRAREAGLKLGYHMMLGLPRSNPSRDGESLSRIFSEEDYRPDQLKIYPTLVVEGTPLYGLWRAGAYRPLEVEEVVDILARFKSTVPSWVRIQRIQREFAAWDIRGGVKRSDLRRLVATAMEDGGLQCRCLRCREVGYRKTRRPIKSLELMRQEYWASRGREVFLSFEDPSEDVVVAYVRIRLGASGTAFVRELRVAGNAVPLSSPPGESWQHRGLGGTLLGEAVAVARDEWGNRDILVTSGAGVREYYRTWGVRRGFRVSMASPGYVSLGWGATA